MKKLLQAGYKKNILTGTLFIGIIICFTVVLKLFALDICKIHGNSMSPAVTNGQYVFISKSQYGIRIPRNIYEIPLFGIIAAYLLPDTQVEKTLNEKKSFSRVFASSAKRGDIVALNNPSRNHFLSIKRCIAISGDSLQSITDSIPFSNLALFETVPYKGEVFDARTITERKFEYLKNNRDFFYNMDDSTFISLDDFIVVIGDNDTQSIDSRNWGPVAMNLVMGKYIFTVKK